MEDEIVGAFSNHVDNTNQNVTLKKNWSTFFQGTWINSTRSMIQFV